jgi:hypothetical protein
MIIAAVHGAVGSWDEILMGVAGLFVLLVLTVAFSRGKAN